MDTQIAVLGAGAWGTTIAKVIAEKKKMSCFGAMKKMSGTALTKKG